MTKAGTRWYFVVSRESWNQKDNVCLIYITCMHINVLLFQTVGLPTVQPLDTGNILTKCHAGITIRSYLVIKKLYTVKSLFSIRDKIRSLCVKSAKKKIMKYVWYKIYKKPQFQFSASNKLQISTILAQIFIFLSLHSLNRFNISSISLAPDRKASQGNAWRLEGGVWWSSSTVTVQAMKEVAVNQKQTKPGKKLPPEVCHIWTFLQF